MKNLTELEEEIYKCSKCGLCQKVCPVYKATGNECSLSRGKFTMLNGVVHKHLEMNNDILKYVDMCLNCNACKNFCPSNIDAREIFRSVKSEYKKTHKNVFKMFFTSYFIFKILMTILNICIRITRFLKIDKLILKNNTFFCPTLVLIARLLKIRTKRKKVSTAFKNSKIIYFQGCSNKYINPSTKNATLNLLNKQSIIPQTPNFECCGLAYYTSGRSEELKKIVNQNLKKLPKTFDFVITDCASCEFMLKMYLEFADEKYIEKAKNLKEKLISITDFLSQRGFEFPKSDTTFTYHKPCHSNFSPKVNHPNYIKMNEFDSCCGFAGTFAFKHNKISKTIAQSKVQNILKTKAKTVITTCPSCIIGLLRGLIDSQITDVEVKNLIELYD